MLEQGFAWLKQNLLDAAKPEVVTIDGPDHIKQYITSDGEIKTVVAPPYPRTFSCQTPSAFVELCDRYKATRAHRIGSCLIAYLDDDSEREEIKLEYRPSTEWTALGRLLSAARDGVAPRDLAFLLRTDLRYVLNQEERARLEKQVGTLKVRTDETADQVSARGRDTMGASIDRQSSPDVELPAELLTIRVRPLENTTVADTRLPVELYIEPDLNSKLWIIREMPDQLHRAREGAIALLHEQTLDAIGDDSNLKIYH